MNPTATSRREFLSRLAAGALSLAAVGLASACGAAPAPPATSSATTSSPAASSSASASSSAVAKGVPITSVSYGGVWEKAVKENFAAYYKRQTGADVTILVGTPSEWMAKVRATQPKPAIDVLLSTATFTYQAIDQGLVVPLDESQVPNLKDVPALFKDRFRGYAASFDGGSYALAYNKDKIKDPPDNWKNLVNAVAAGKLGNRIMWPHITQGGSGAEVFNLVNEAFGGDFDNIQPGLDAMKRAKVYIAKFYADVPSPGEALLSGEAELAIWADGRLWALVVGGAKQLWFKYLKPKSPMTTVDVMMVKNAPESAWVYVNGMFDPDAQTGFIKYFPGYIITNKKARYDKTAEEFLEPSAKDFSFTNFSLTPEKIGLLLPKWAEQWNKQIGA